MLKIFLFFPIFTFTLYSQAKIENYKQNGSIISFELSIKSLNKTAIQDLSGETAVGFNNYFDESKPGSYALPSGEIFIALPSYSKVNIKVLPVSEDRIKGRPLLNPNLKLLNDSTLTYYPATIKQNYKNDNRLFRLKGYLWIKNYYCVDLELNQYRFNNSDIISQLKKIKIILDINNPERSVHYDVKTKDDEFEKSLKNLIVNYSEAYQLKKSLYVKSNFKDGWINFNNTYLKLGVADDGIYRIGRADLESYGISPGGINPETFKVFVKGKEQPVYVRGENDKSFDQNDYIEFFGSKNYGDNYHETSSSNEPYKEYLNRYSDTTIYWLTWGGENGLRIDTMSSYSGTPDDTLYHYSEVAHYEKDLYLDYSVFSLVDRQDPDWLANETWVWGQQGVGTANRTFSASDIYPGKTAKAFYKVQDFASDISQNAHKIGISINSDPAVYDSSAFDKYAQKVVRAEFSSNLLNEGNNVLKTISFPTGAGINSIEYDWYEIEYPRYLKAQNDSLKILFDDISLPGLKTIKISNVSSNDIVIYKYSGELKKITNYLKSGSKIIFSDTVNNGDRYIITPASEIASPKIYYKKNFDDLKNQTYQADYILITHPLFLDKANEYANFIKDNYSLATKVINIRDIYDEFNFGFFAPEPIRDFLKAANIYWQDPKPAYLFLVGDATYDYYGNKTKYFGSPPAYNFVPSYGYPVSDNWFVTWDTTGSLVQQMYAGRIPVNSVAEFDHYFDKHKKYLSDQYDVFNKTYLLFSGGETNNPSELQTLRTTNDFIKNNLIKPPPVGGIARHLYKTANPVSNFGPVGDKQVSDYIGAGGLFVSYIGHSGTQIWDNGINTVAQLKNNSGKGSLISDWGCSTGKFAEPDIKAFSELFIDGRDGQAIGYTGNTSLGFISTATVFPELFYSELLQRNVTGIGRAHAIALNDFIKSYGSSGVYRIFALCNALLGDPVINLKVPPGPNLTPGGSDVILKSKGNTVIDDSRDSVGVIIRYNNLGKVDSSSFQIRVEDILNGNEILNKIYSKTLPAYTDSVVVYLPTKNLPGNHQLKITLDDSNQIQEISESDNVLNYDINVASSSVRLLVKGSDNLTSNGQFTFLNPVLKSSSDSLRIEYADNPDFVNGNLLIARMDTVVTKVTLTGLVPGKRYWLKYKINSAGSSYDKIISFIYSSQQGFRYSFKDTVSFAGTKTNNLKLNSSGIRLEPSKKELELQSAGFYDGSYGLITLDGTNYVPNSNAGGYHLVVFDEKTLKFDYQIYLNYYDDQSNYETNFLAAIDSIPDNKIIAIATSDEPAGGLSASIKNKLKSIGSTLIDSVNFRNSWGIITKKNYTPGKVLEGRTKSYNGPVILDTIFTSQISSGSLETGILGPSGQWDNLQTFAHIPQNSSINLQAVEFKPDESTDTLKVDIATGNFILYGIDAKKYPYLKLILQFNSSDSTALPDMGSLDLDFKTSPELGTNYQLVYLANDSVKIGENVKLNFSIMNAGETAADSFKVRVDLFNPDNSSEEIYHKDVKELGAGQKNDFSLNYNTNSTGHQYFKIIIDPDNKIPELFKDNNIYSVPFDVLPDTNRPGLKITFDGREIVDNDFVSSKPRIKIELNDPSYLPVTDTSSISISVNNNPVYYTNNNKLSYNFNSSNPKMVVEYTPEFNDGEYSLSVSAKNDLGNKSENETKQFVVSSTPQILNLYNYPNPFNSETYFTFKLSQIPDELKINIYTVAGRLIKEFILHQSDLNYDFNRIYWDGRDQDGDLVGNGVYLYKAIMKSGGITQSLTQKLAVVR